MEQNRSEIKPSIKDLIKDLKSDRNKMERYVRYIKEFNNEWREGDYGSLVQETGKHIWGQRIYISPKQKIIDAFSDLDYPPVHNFFAANDLVYIEDIDEEVLMELLFENRVGMKGYFAVLDKLFNEEEQVEPSSSADKIHLRKAAFGYINGGNAPEERDIRMTETNRELAVDMSEVNDPNNNKEPGINLKEIKEKIEFEDVPTVEPSILEELNSKIKGIYSEYEKAHTIIWEQKNVIKSMIEDIENKESQIESLKGHFSKAMAEINDLHTLSRKMLTDHNIEKEYLMARLVVAVEDLEKSEKEHKSILEELRMDKDILVSKLDAAERETKEYKDLFEAQLASEKGKMKQIEELNFRIYEMEENNRRSLKEKDTEISGLRQLIKEKEEEFEHFGSLRKLIDNLSTRLAK